VKVGQTILQDRAPAGTSTAPRIKSFFGLPPALVIKARARVKFLAALFTAMCGVGVLVTLLLAVEGTRGVLYTVYVVNGILSAALYAAARIERVRHGVVLHLALVYEVIVCGVVSVGHPWAQYAEFGALPAVTWTCIVIVATPLVIPTPPARTLLAALAAAATVPLGLWILTTQGIVVVEPLDYLTGSISPLLCVLIAVLGSRVVYGLNVDVAKAQEMGSYRLVERVASGGMGEVWRAEHRLLARPAAIKLVKPEIMGGDPRDTARVTRRFEREARATAALKSPHTVELYDFGVTDEGAFYYVMELLEGVDLQRLVEKHGPLPAERAVHVLRQACHSLREAHSIGLVHRDIKPANLLVCRYGPDLDFVKVLDFGLVTLQLRRGTEGAQMTAEQTLLGTPAFMPPEMITNPDAVDARADIYALGCVAHWLLTGRILFEESTPMAILLAHAQRPAKAPSETAESPIPPELDRIVLSCLEKEPEKRPVSAEDLDRQLASLSWTAPWTAERAQQWWQANMPPATDSARVAWELVPGK